MSEVYNSHGIHLIPTVSEDEVRLQRAITGLLAVTPRNEYGFPLGIYRPDLLPMHDYQPEAESVDALFPQRDGDVALQHLPPSSAATDSTRAEINGNGNGRSPFSLDKLREAAEGLLDDVLEDQEEEEEDIEEDDDGELEEYASKGQDVTHTSTPAPTQNLGGRVAGFKREHLRAAFIQLNYDEGYPVLPDGRPIWDKLDFEPKDAFLCFQTYLQMPSYAGGVRTISDLSALMEANSLLDVTGNGYLHRQFAAKFKCYAAIYNWHLRAKSYDLFRIAAFRKKQELRQTNIQDAHYVMADKLLNRLMDYMESEEDFWDMMSPKVAIDTLKTLTALQRVSTGLPASAPASGTRGSDGTEGAQSFEMILRTLSHKGDGGDEGSPSGSIIDGASGVAQKILSDPDATRMAQELILRMSKG